MRRFLPRVLLATVVAVSAAGCASGAAGGAEDGGSEGGRYRVLIPDLQGPEGDRVANVVRSNISEMLTHTAVSEREMRRAMDAYEVPQLDEITARQLAQQMSYQNVLWGTVEQGGAGLQAEVKFIDVQSGDEIALDDISGADANELGQAIFAAVDRSVEGIRQAAFCNDYLSSQQFDTALETCTEALEIVPQSTSALYGRATALLNLERPEEALEDYEAVLAIDPMHEDALLGAGLAASQLGQSDEATDFYNQYLEVNPGNVQVRMSVAGRIAETGDYVSAYNVLEPAIADNEDDAEFQEYLFSIATAAGLEVQESQDDEAARPYFEAAMRAYEVAFGTGEAELDASTLRQAIAVNNAIGDRDAAMRLAREATERFDTVAAVWSQYASVLNDAEQYDEAIQALTRVIELDPEYQDVYIRRGSAYLAAGNRDRALADLERAADAGDRDRVASVIYNEGARAYQANNFGEAVNLLTIADRYASGETKAAIQFIIGVSYYRQGEAIARANEQGSVDAARRALRFFEQALPYLQRSTNAQAAQLVDATNQFIENQEAIIRAAGG